MCSSRSSSSAHGLPGRALPAGLLFLRSLSLGSGVCELGRRQAGHPSDALQPVCAHLCPPECRSAIPPHLFPLESCEPWGEGAGGAPVCFGFVLPCAPCLFGVGEQGAAKGPTPFACCYVRACVRALIPRKQPLAPRTLCPRSLCKLFLWLQSRTVLLEGGWDRGEAG